MNTRWIVLLQDLTACSGPGHSADLASALVSLGLEEVSFDEENLFVLFNSELESEELEVSLKTVVREWYGLRARFALLRLADFHQVMADNPFPNDTRDNPESVYLLFLKRRPVEPIADNLDSLKSAEESWALVASTLYLVIPSGFTNSKLALEAQPQIGVGAVVRTWNEIQRSAAGLE